MKFINTKPGGSTCSEGLAKGLPMLFYKPIPGQEEENCLYLTSNGFGEELKSTDTLKACFRELVEQYPLAANRRRTLTKTNVHYNPTGCFQTIMKYTE